MIALSRILVPTNLGEPSKAAITYGVAFARQFGASLFLLRVLSAEDYDVAIEGERAVETLLPDAAPAVDGVPIEKNAARFGLRQLLRPADERDARAEYLLRPAGSGGPGAEIVTVAQEHAIDLIVMGKHRLGFVEHLLAGSVTERVMRHAPCPVLIVQHPEHEFVVPDSPHQEAER